MAEKVLTAPLALVKVGNQVVGRMRNIRVTETTRRGRVSGIGELTPQEVPAVEWNGTATCQFYEIKFRTTGIPGASRRESESVRQYIDDVLLQEEGVTIVLMKKVAGGVNPSTGQIESTLQPHLTISEAFLDREGMDINEGQISGHDQDFTYTNPILFNP